MGKTIIRDDFWRLWGTFRAVFGSPSGAFRVPFGIPGAPLGCLLGSLGDPWGTFGTTLGVQRATIAHGPKTEQAQKTSPPALGHFWLQNGSPGCQNEVNKLYLIFFQPKKCTKIRAFSGYVLQSKSVKRNIVFRTFVDGKTIQRRRTRKSATSRFYSYLQYFSTIFRSTETDRVGRIFVK